MDMGDPRSLLRAGIGAYGISFFLVAESFVRRTGMQCALVALVAPLIAAVAPEFAEVFDGNPVGHIALFISGLVNIVFPFAVLFKFNGDRHAFAATRIAVLVMIPFSWIVFVLLPDLPREGHLLWVAGMLVALFSEEIAARRRASSGGPGAQSPDSAPGAPMMPSV